MTIKNIGDILKKQQELYKEYDKDILITLRKDLELDDSNLDRANFKIKYNHYKDIQNSYLKEIDLKLKPLYNERLTQLKDNELNGNYLIQAKEIIENTTKISKKDLPNLLLTLEAMSWTDSFGYINLSTPDAYIFGSSQNTKWYNDIDILCNSERAIGNIKNFKNSYQGIKFKELFEKFGGGYCGFLEHAEYKLTFQKGNWNNFGKTKIHLTHADDENKNLPKNFKKIQILFRE